MLGALVKWLFFILTRFPLSVKYLNMALMDWLNDDFSSGVGCYVVKDSDLGSKATVSLSLCSGYVGLTLGCRLRQSFLPRSHA